MVHGVGLLRVAEEGLVQATARACDARIPGGTLIGAVLERLIAFGTHLATAVYGVAPMSPVRLVASGTASLE